MKYTSALLSSLLYLAPAASASVYADHANAAIKVLQDKYYNTATGLWKGEKTDLWWQSGNIVETLARFGQIDASFKPTAINILANTYSKAANKQGAKNWKNDFYDDMGWWALGWIATYDLTKDAKYLNTAKDIFDDMTGGWTTPCKGGIWWDKKKTSVNAIANELFISVAAHLANRVPAADKEHYLHFAQMDWDWFKGTGMINKDNVINDGLTLSTCKNDGKTTFTYNQGVILGGLSELAKAKNDGGFINHATKLVDGSFAKLVSSGILNEPSNTMGETGGMFKGAYVRGLASLNSNVHNQKYTDFLKKNADTLWDKARNSNGVFEDKWQGGSSNVNPSTHASGIDVLVAAAAVA